jgi:hypothetical protein
MSRAVSNLLVFGDQDLEEASSDFSGNVSLFQTPFPPRARFEV